MKYTLLEMVQLILSSMDSEEVNSITDTVEADQIAKIIRDNYFEIVSNGNMPELYDFFELNASGTSTKPTLMTLPSDVSDLVWVKYDNKTSADSETVLFKDVNYLDLDEFLRRMYSLDDSESTVGHFTHTIGSDTFNFLFHNDRFPKFYTTWNDNTLIFDAYDSAVDTTLQKSKTLCWGMKIPTFTMSDNFVPDLDSLQFRILVQEAKAQAFAELKQVQNANAERKARRAWINQQYQKRNIPSKRSTFSDLPNYGRK